MPPPPPTPAAPGEPAPGAAVLADACADAADAADAPPQPSEEALVRPGRSSWSDDATRASLLMLADTVRHATGFEVVSVCVVDDQRMCENVAVAARDDVREELLGTRVPVDPLLGLLDAAAEVVGALYLVREEDNKLHGLWGWVPDHLRPTDDVAWHPRDWLVALARDDDGAVVGLVQLDMPTDGCRPDVEVMARVARRCQVALEAVVAAHDRERLAVRTRMAVTARDVVRGSAGRRSIEAILESCHRAVMDGYRARALFIQLLDDGGRTATFVTEAGQEVLLPETVTDLAERDARIGWERQQVAVVDHDHPRGGWLSVEEGEYLLGFLDRIAVGSILFVPMGVGPTCLGSLTLLRATGDPAWSHAELSTALDIGRDLGHAIVNARAHRREQQLLTELRQLDAYKSELIATVSHELRNPLSAVSGHLELLEAADDLPASAGRSLTAMRRGARRLERIIEDLLLFSKAGDPSREFRPGVVDLAAVVRDVADLYRAAPGSERVSTDLPPGPVLVRGVAEELDCVVSNLLSNALKYSDDGTRVRLRLRDEVREVVLTCADDGLGVAAEEQQEIFREFFRSADPGVRREGGTGLGLAIVGRIVERHRGRVGVVSELGAGSVFTVYLPGREEFERLEAAQAQQTVEPDGLGRPRVAPDDAGPRRSAGTDATTDVAAG